MRSRHLDGFIKRAANEGHHMNVSSLGTRWRSLEPYLLSILRIVAAFLFMQFGTAKWFAFPAPIMPDGGTVALASLVGIAAVLEAVGGLLLLVGLFTRPVAFLLSGQMAVAYFIGHAPQGFWPVLNQGTPAILFSFLWLYLSAAGPGPWSLDAPRARGEPKDSQGGHVDVSVNDRRPDRAR
jgi:putative oxidoreductase